MEVGRAAQVGPGPEAADGPRRVRVWLTGRYLNNWSLVAAAAAIEADRAGIGKYRAKTLRFLKNQYLPKIRSGYGGDPGGWPLAYHAFGLAWLAHVAEAHG